MDIAGSDRQLETNKTQVERRVTSSVYVYSYARDIKYIVIKGHQTSKFVGSKAADPSYTKIAGICDLSHTA